MTSRQRMLAALRGESLDRPPVWIMRQAGRYLPEYRKLKETHDFLTLAQTPELAVEVTLQPLKRFPLDAAILFSDILVIPEALGQPYHFREEGGIGMEFALEGEADIARLDPSGIREKLAYVAQALTILRGELDGSRALLGFGGSPWTLATYMIEGGSSRDFVRTKSLALGQPALFARLMEKLVAGLAEYFQMQIDAGADAIQIFDSWGAACPGHRYSEFSLRWIGAILNQLPTDFPVIVYAKGMAHYADDIAALGASAVSVDWTVDLPSWRRRHTTAPAVQGNLDPVLLSGDPETAAGEARRLLDGMHGLPGHIFNLGHGILPSARIDTVERVVDTVVRYAQR